MIPALPVTSQGLGQQACAIGCEELALRGKWLGHPQTYLGISTPPVHVL